MDSCQLNIFIASVPPVTSDLILLKVIVMSLFSVQQPHTVNYPKNSTDLEKTKYIALCLQSPTEMLGTSMLLKCVFCHNVHMFERRQNQDDF